jgi:hypothetical protein
MSLRGGGDDGTVHGNASNNAFLKVGFGEVRKN